jgi:O-acetyl-ADP-ribose deacetylase (regulator of RNase III)
MTVSIKTGDLLNEKTEAIVNTVNCVGVMGKGIALQFKQRWPENFKDYAAACKREEIKPGKMFIHDFGEWAKPRFIINFPTKVHWKGDSKIEYIEEGLRDLTAQVKRLRIKSVALPPLGCGNGGLDWNEVRCLITEAFEKLPDVQVDLFEPKGAPPPQKMIIATQKPKLTGVRAAIVKVISIYRVMEYALTRIEMQKLAYFLEMAGQPLKLGFTQSNYGPYSNKLRFVLTDLNGHYITGVGDGAGDSEIAVLPEALVEADEYIKTSGDDKLVDDVDRVGRLIQGFESPYGMELLATVHWVGFHIPDVHTVDAAIKAVHNWNDRKRAIMSKEHIKIAWHRLEEQGWFRPVRVSRKTRLPLQ